MANYRLFSWGANSHGQLGHGDIPEDELFVPREVDLSFTNVEIDKIKKITAGAGHSLILDETGNVFSCGWNNDGQAGFDELQTIYRFRKLESLEGQKIVDIACGWDSSMALTDQGEVFAWGSNLYGQLGLADLKFTSTPTRVELELPIEKMAIGLRHSALVTWDSRVMVSGAASKGQLGIDLEGARSLNWFFEVPDLCNVVDVACGQHHTLIATGDNEIFSWGDNKHEQLGINSEIRKTAPRPMKMTNIKNVHVIKKIYCGWTHSAILTSEAKVLLWGRNTYGQLGRTKAASPKLLWKAKPPKMSLKTRQIAFGSEHNVVLADNGTVMSWGWNEHGNCGNGNTEDCFEPIKVLLPDDCKGVLVGAGAGHSFALVETNIDC